MNAAMGLDSMKEMGGMGPFSESDFKGIGSVTMDDLAKSGRFGDKFLAHVADGEMVLPKPFLDQNPFIKDKIYQEMDAMGIKPADFTVNGGDLTNVNPKTGMPEFGFFSKVFKAVKKVVKPIANVVLPIAATVACGGNPACGAAASAALTKAQGGSWGDALKSAAFTYAGQSFAQGMGSSMTAVDPATGQALTGWDAISTGLNPFDATGGLQMPTALGNTTGTYGATQAANPVQGFFQSMGGAVKGAITPGMTMSQGYSGGVAVPSNISQLGTSASNAYSASINEQAAKGVFGAAADANAQVAAVRAAQAAPMGGVTATTPGVTFSTTGGQTGGGITNIPTTPAAQSSANVLTTGTGGETGFLDSVMNFAKENPMTTAAAAAAIPAIGAYMAAQEPIPENEMVKYDETARKEIEAYNTCINNPATKGTCSVPTDLKMVPSDYNISGTPGSMYSQFAAAKQAGTPAQGYGPAPTQPTGTNILDLYKQFASRPVAQPQAKYGLQALLAADGGHIAGPGTGTSDDIPAMLSDGEFVMTAKAVRGAGNGSRQDGVKKMYNMMRQFEGVA